MMTPPGMSQRCCNSRHLTESEMAELLYPIVAEIESFGAMDPVVLKQAVAPFIRAMQTVGVPYSPSTWFGALAPAERKRLTRATKRLEVLGYLERVTEPNRDRATHVRPTYAALAWVIDTAGESVNLAELSEGLSRCEWADDLGRQLRAGDRTQHFPAAVAARFTGEERDA